MYVLPKSPSVHRPKAENYIFAADSFFFIFFFLFNSGGGTLSSYSQQFQFIFSFDYCLGMGREFPKQESKTVMTETSWEYCLVYTKVVIP